MSDDAAILYAEWTGRLAAAVAMAHAALEARAPTEARVILDTSLRGFLASPVADEEMQRELRAIR